MDDLISRKALAEWVHANVPAYTPDALITKSFVMAALSTKSITPSVPAVPLDKLCEYLNSVIYPCIVCKESPGPQCNAKRKGCWERVLTKWMEGLDAEVH